MELPVDVPIILQFPAAMMVIEVPLTVHTPVVSDVKTTVPADAEALIVNGAEPNRFKGMSLNEIVFAVAV